MNIETGELIRLSQLLNGEEKRTVEEQEKELRKRMFEPVPKELESEAEKELGEKDRVFVDLKKNTPLANWANDQRRQQGQGCKAKKNMRKIHRKIASSSKKRNRK